VVVVVSVTSLQSLLFFLDACFYVCDEVCKLVSNAVCLLVKMARAVVNVLKVSE